MDCDEFSEYRSRSRGKTRGNQIISNSTDFTAPVGLLQVAQRRKFVTRQKPRGRRRRVSREYFGDPGVANRLYAARVAAGFRSGRAAALKFGLSDSLLRAHETATRGIEDDDLIRQYARVFGVSEDWLRAGRGDGVPVDPKRLARIQDRNAERRREAPLLGTVPAAAKRLRVARRLAGYRTLTAAAKRFKWSRTTASSHEAGQNSISPDWARTYGSAYGANADWLLAGTLPSGYPAEIEPHLNALAELHAEPESIARDHFPAVSIPPGTVPKPPKFKRKPAKKLRLRPAEDVPEITAAELIAATERANQHRFSFPPGYLSDVLRADPDKTIVVPSTNRFADIEIGDRLVVDTAQTNPNLKGAYLCVRRDGTMDLARTAEHTTAPTGTGDQVVGRLVAVLKAFTQG